MLQIYESAIHRIFVACAVIMEAKFPYFNLKLDVRNLATTNLVHKLYELHKKIKLGMLWLEFL